MHTRSRKKTLKFRLSPDHTALLSALNEHSVEYLIIGGYAVGFHSEPRATKDLDVFVRAGEQNSQATFKALAAFGAPLVGLTPADFNDGSSFFQMGYPPERIDVLQRISGVEFDESWKSRVYAVVNGTLRVPVISAEKLIANKLAVGRPRDLLDVSAIREAQAFMPAGEGISLRIEGWTVGFNKVECTKILRVYLGLGLTDGKALTDTLVEGKSITIQLNAAQVPAFSAAMLDIGVKNIAPV